MLHVGAYSWWRRQVSRYHHVRSSAEAISQLGLSAGLQRDHVEATMTVIGSHVFFQVNMFEVSRQIWKHPPRFIKRHLLIIWQNKYGIMVSVCKTWTSVRELMEPTQCTRPGCGWRSRVEEVCGVNCTTLFKQTEIRRESIRNPQRGHGADCCPM